MGVFGSVGRGDDRPGSDIDMLLVTRDGVRPSPSRSVEHPKSRIIEGIPVTFLQWTPEQARDEVMGSRKDLNVALAGWRSLRPLHDPDRFLARLRARSFHPTPTQWRRAARRALLETFEDLGKLRNAVEAEDLDELREMAIWYTDGAMGALFDLNRFVLPTGRRAFIEALRFGGTGRAIRRLRYENESPGAAGRLADSIWSDLMRRAHRQGIRMPPLLSRSAHDNPPRASRVSVAEQFVKRVRLKEGRNLVGAGLYGSVASGEDRRHSDIDLILALRQPRGYPRITVSKDCLVSISERTPKEVRQEIACCPWNLPELLSGWRSMRIMHDPSGILRRAVARSRRPSDRMFRRAALENLFEAYEFLGKLSKAARAKDVDETREMAIWFSGNAMMAFLCLERHIVETGRKLLAETRGLGPLGQRIYRLRTESHGVEETTRLANAVWASLLARARRAGIRLPEGLRSHGASRDTT
jgi:predicted nucleotidyltransferase